jgi:lysophospholipase L1-like esterase
MKNWLIAFLSIALSLVAFELILRALVPESGLGRFGSEKVENIEFSYVTTHNSLGYRGEEFSRNSPPGTRRVLFIGDSFVYGVGAARAETIPSLLENKLNSLEKSKFEVLNLGLPDGNTVQYLETAKAFADFDADIVLLGFFVDNDVWAYEKESVRFFLWDLIKRVMSTFYYNIFKICRYEWVNDYKIDQSYKDLACEEKISPYVLSRANEIKSNEHNFYKYMAKLLLRDSAIIENIKLIEEIFADKIFFVTIFPSKVQISNAYFDEMKRLGFKFRRNKPINSKIQSNLKKLLRRNGILYIDLRPAIRESHDLHNRKHYYDIDSHFNPFGNEVVATAIAEALQPRLAE